jgi:2Fe-2S ferredoxin
MEVIRDAGLPIKAECNGALSCATCHVYVDEGWTARLPPATPEEREMLDGAFDVRGNSRLSCQIILTEKLDGLALALAPGSEP